jgi:hypothetical protein
MAIYITAPGVVRRSQRMGLCNSPVSWLAPRLLALGTDMA